MKLLLGNDEILFQFLSYNSIVILYKNTFYNYDELQMSSCAVYFILNTVLVYINRKLVHAEYISICCNASNTCHKHMREKQL